MKLKQTKFNPAKIIVSSFLAMILIGTALLMLPFATTNGISLIDALFTATSAVCVTGLIVKNTPVDFTYFGQWTILVLIQLGGIGYMTFASFGIFLIGKKMTLAQSILAKEFLNLNSLENLKQFLIRILLFVFGIEFIGVFLLYQRFSSLIDSKEALLQSVFHAVSAFNNAGFSLFEENLVAFKGDISINLTIMGLIILGGIGFIVVNDIYNNLRKNRKFLLHTKVVLWSTLFLILIGAFLFFFNERKHMLALPEFGLKDTLMTSFFASVTARTAGFNTVDYSTLQTSTIFFIMILMIIGASPGSTGGGIKTTTFSVILIHLWSSMRGYQDTVLLKRRIQPGIITRCFVIFVIFILFINFLTILIIDLEHSDFQKTVFEVVSALATVGLSFGDGSNCSFSATFSSLSKGIIILTMIAGRIGPLTLMMTMFKTEEAKRIRYPEGRVMIG